MEKGQLHASSISHKATYISTSAGLYDLHGGTSGALLRAGQIVRAEVGFRVVPVGGGRFALRMDLKSATIINDDIVAVSDGTCLYSHTPILNMDK